MSGERVVTGAVEMLVLDCMCADRWLTLAVCTAPIWFTAVILGFISRQSRRKVRTVLR